MKKLLLISIILLLVSLWNYAQLPSDSLIAKYLFNNNAMDESGNGNNGIVSGATFIQDRFTLDKSAVCFNGIDDLIDIGRMNNLNSSLENFSVSFWIKSDTIEKFYYETVMKTINDAPKGTLFSIEILRGRSASFNPGVVRLDIRDEFDKYFTILIDKPEIFDNNWHNIIFVVESASKNKGEVFVDGLFVEKDSAFGAQSPSVYEPFEHSLTIGAANNRGQIETYFRGALDDIRFYNKSLEAAEIEKLYYECFYHEIIYDTITISKCDSIIFDTITVYDTIHINLCHEILYDTVNYYDTIIVSDTLVIVLNPQSADPEETHIIISVFPNPSSEMIYISTSDVFFTEQYMVKIFNNHGSLICEFLLDSEVKEVDLDQFGGPGIYYLQILNDKSEIIESRKILLIR